ncbi:MAG TPA: hypothetical protein VIL63_06865 [Terriglobales bacterium]
MLSMILVMDHLDHKSRSVLPIEIIIVLAINLVVAVFAYYAITMWDIFAKS